MSTPDVPDDVTTTTSSQVKATIAIRPDGIAADPKPAGEVLGMDLLTADRFSGRDDDARGQTLRIASPKDSGRHEPFGVYPRRCRTPTPY
jgi:hypothetical protein